MRSKEEFKEALIKVIGDHPESDIKPAAQEILAVLNRDGEIKAPKSEKPPYVYDPMEDHIYVMSLPAKTKKSEELKILISNFNKEFFRENYLNFANSVMKNRKLFLIRSFKNQKEALRYLKAIRNKLDISLAAKQEGGFDYIITNDNFRLLFKNKDESLYLDFFKDKYPT